MADDSTASEATKTLAERCGFSIQDHVCDECLRLHPEWHEGKPVRPPNPELPPGEYAWRLPPDHPFKVALASYFDRLASHWAPHEVPCIIFDYDDMRNQLCRKHALELAALVPEPPAIGQEEGRE